MAVSEVDATTENPGGACVTASPCDIQTFCESGSDEKISAVVVAVKSVRPYSDFPVWLTTPPRPCAIAWNP